MSDFTKFANELLSQAYLQVFAHGNILPDVSENQFQSTYR